MVVFFAKFGGGKRRALVCTAGQSPLIAHIDGGVVTLAQLFTLDVFVVEIDLFVLVEFGLELIAALLNQLFGGKVPR